MPYRILGDKAIKSKDQQIDIKIVKEVVIKREMENRILLGGWIRVSDLIKEIRVNHGIAITANDVRALSNACPLELSNCNSFIRAVSNKSSVSCVGVEEDSIWFSKDFNDKWLSQLIPYGDNVSYIEIMPYPFEEYSKEIKGKVLYDYVIPIISKDDKTLLPIYKDLMEG